jgi:hypothetical protein
MAVSSPTDPPNSTAGLIASNRVNLINALRLVSFALGAAVIIDAVVQRAGAVQWVAGLLLVGIVPPEAVAGAFRKKP